MERKWLYIVAVLMLMLHSCEKLNTDLPQETKNTAGSSEENITARSVDDIICGDISTDTTVWVCGYIVGYVNGTKMSSAQFAAGNKLSNILLADSPLETDYHNCIPVQLNTTPAASKQVREALNLSTHPENLKQKVGIYGTITSYMGTVGMKNVTKHKMLEDDFDYENYNSTPNNNGDGTENNNDETGNNNDGTGNTPTPQDPENYDDNDLSGKDPLSIDTYTVSYMRNELTDYFNENAIASITECTVKGYIVGYVRKNKNNISQTSFELTFPVESNIVLADSPNERDYNNCIAVQLSTGSTYLPARNALNLSAHPENHGKYVIVLGRIEKYMGALGVKNTREYTFPEED